VTLSAQPGSGHCDVQNGTTLSTCERGVTTASGHTPSFLISKFLSKSLQGCSTPEKKNSCGFELTGWMLGQFTGLGSQSFSFNIFLSTTRLCSGPVGVAMCSSPRGMSCNLLHVKRELRSHFHIVESRKVVVKAGSRMARCETEKFGLF
jgi:hypothetical protein